MSESVKKSGDTDRKSDTVGGSAICFLCEQPIQNKLYVQEIPGVEVAKNKFVCSVHLDLCTACWGPHQSVFGGKSATDKKEADHYWAAKAFKRGVPNAAPYFFFKGLQGVENERERNRIRKEEMPYFECCHPQCFCMKCNKPKIVSRFIDGELFDLYCSCHNVSVPTSIDHASEMKPNWETYGSLGSSTHEEGPFALPYIFFEFLYVSLCDLSRKRTQGIKLSPNDQFLDETWERYLTNPRLKTEKPAISKNNIAFAVQDCNFFLGLSNDRKGSEILEVLFHYIHTLFRTASASWPELLEAVDEMPEDKRNGAELFNLIRDKRFRIPLMSVLLWHLNRNKPWGDVVTGDKFGELTNEAFMEYKNTVKKESEGHKYGAKELSYLYRTSPQIIIQNDLGLNVFGRGLRFFPETKQREAIDKLFAEDHPILQNAQSTVDHLNEDLSTSVSANATPNDVTLFTKESRQLAPRDTVSPFHYKSLFDYSRSFERALVGEASKEDFLEDEEGFNAKEALLLSSCEQIRKDQDSPNTGVITSNDLMRAALGTDCEPDIFQQKFALKLANAVCLPDADEKYPSLSKEEIEKLRLGVYSKGAVNSLATTASPLFRSKFHNYIKALKHAKQENGSPDSLKSLDKAINELIQQVAGDAAKLFVSKEGKVGMLLLTGKMMKKKREELDMPDNVNNWIKKSEMGYDPEGIDGKTYDAIMRALETDKSLPWMIATPTFESYLESVLENPTFANTSASIDDIDDLVNQSNALFKDDSEDNSNNKFEDKIRQRNEAAMRITPPLRTTESNIEELSERLLNDQLTNQIPDASLLNSLSAIDPESVYNNPGLLKIITETEMGVKSEESNISNIEKMKKQLAGSGGNTENKAKRYKDMIGDICKSNPDLLNCIEFLDEDLINEANNTPNYQSFLDRNREKIVELTPLEKIVFANDTILNNKNVDPMRKETLCKEILDSLSPEEKAILTANDRNKFAELFPRYESLQHSTVPDDKVKLIERAESSVEHCLQSNPDQSFFSLAELIPALVKKRFDELRQFAKENGAGEERHKDLGLTDSEVNSAVRRALEALYHRAMTEKGPDDNEVNAIGYLLEKAKQKELAHPANHEMCAECQSKKCASKCMVTVGDELIMRCLDESPQCVECSRSMKLLCLNKFHESKTGDGEHLPSCPPLHHETYYVKNAQQIVNLMLTDCVDEEFRETISFACEGCENFQFWRNVQKQLDQDLNVMDVEPTDRHACKFIWKNHSTPENAVDELMFLTSLYDTVESCLDGSLTLGVNALRILTRSRAREVMDIAVLALISAAEFSSMYDDFQTLAHTFNNVLF